MTSVPHEPSRRVGKAGSESQLLGPEMWASVAISVMWLAVLFDAIFGPNIVSTSGAGSGQSATVPSAVVVALFAFLGSWVVAHYAFRGRKE